MFWLFLLPFFLILPIRPKNPPEHPPYCTLGLVGVNVIVFLCTINYSNFEVLQRVVNCCAVTPTTTSHVYNLFTALFLHENVLHIAGNMIFLYIFGAALEGRVGPGRFLIIYFLAGLIGGLGQDLFEISLQDDSPCLGASGAIMGLVGAYWWVYPHAQIRVFRIFFWAPGLVMRPLVRINRFGMADWRAWWVIAYYVLYDNLWPLIWRQNDGVGYGAHIGGASTGLLLAVLMKVRRDSEQVSDIQAVRSDVKGDFEQMTLYELDTLLETPTENMDLVTAYCKKALLDGGPTGEMKCVKMLSRYRLKLVDNGDPFKIVQVVLRIPISSDTLPQVFYLKLGGRLEAMQYQDDAGLCYRRVFDMDKTSREAEIALIRLGRMLENYYHNPDQAREAYTVLIHLFPTSPAVEEAQKALRRLTPPSETAPV